MARPRSDIAPRLVVAARARFLRDGVDGASLRDIARKARTSLGMIHYYYPAKDDLFLAVVEEVYAPLSDDIVAIVGDEDRPLEERIRGLYRRIASASTKEMDTLRLVLREVLVSSERRRLLLERFVRGHIPALLRALVAGVHSGAVDGRHPLPAAALATFAVGLFPQILRRIVDERLAPVPLPPPEELASALATVVFSGLSPRSA